MFFIFRNDNERYWTGDGFSTNPFSKAEYSAEEAYWVKQELIEKGHDFDNIEICPV